jgi:hypothetical protein
MRKDNDLKKAVRLQITVLTNDDDRGEYILISDAEELVTFKKV